MKDYEFYILKAFNDLNRKFHRSISPKHVRKKLIKDGTVTPPVLSRNMERFMTTYKTLFLKNTDHWESQRYSLSEKGKNTLEVELEVRA